MEVQALVELTPATVMAKWAAAAAISYHRLWAGRSALRQEAASQARIASTTSSVSQTRILRLGFPMSVASVQAQLHPQEAATQEAAQARDAHFGHYLRSHGAHRLT